MFHFSAKGEYAVLAILALSLHSSEEPLQVKSIARKEGISVRFLEQVMSLLKKRGLVESVRGPHGGYRLIKSPAQIRLGEVLQAVEGPFTAIGLSDKRRDNFFGFNERKIETVVLQEVTDAVNASLRDHLNAISFEDLCERKREREEKRELMFHI
ncbi:MAG: RrF2 family transcriptional regulator [Nitrospiria bacterium]